MSLLESRPLYRSQQARSELRGRRVAEAARGVDWLLVLLTSALCVAGALSVYAATRNGLAAHGRNPHAYLDRDLINAAVGTAMALPLAFIDYRSLRALAPFLYAGAMLALLLVLSPAGSRINGAHAWFTLGSVQLEPSEFAKLAIILVGAGLLGEPRDTPSGQPRTRDVLLTLAAAGVPLLLILAEPALGIAIVVAVIVVVLLVVGNAPARWVGGLLAAAGLGVALVLHLHLLKPYQEQRFTAFTHPRADTSATGYHTAQSEIAIGSGGLLGQGFLDGSQTNGGFIPEQQTDFIFTVTAEEGGLLGGAVLLSLLGALFLRGYRIAERAPDRFGQMIATAVVSWLAFQAFVNVGMTLGIMPVTGLPLPFVSYGGSAMFADLLGVGLLLSIHRVTQQETGR